MKRTICLAGVALLSGPLTLAAQQPHDSGTPSRFAPPVVRETTLDLRDGTVLRYALSLPADLEASAGTPRPLVLALHPGGRDVYYGSWFMQTIVEPALRDWGAVMVAPDVPDRSWTTERSERALLELVEHVLEAHHVDADRVLITGFSMGGRGAWHNAALHPERFTGAIVMAGSPEGVETEALADTPLFLIHSPDDAVVPFEPVARAYEHLAAGGHPIRLEALPDVGHYEMGGYIPALAEAAAWIREQWLEQAP